MAIKTVSFKHGMIAENIKCHVFLRNFYVFLAVVAI